MRKLQPCTKIINNRPYTLEMNGGIDDSLITDKDSETQNEVNKWISENIIPTVKTPLKDHSSYGIKHVLQKDTGIYLTNNEFKDAMLQNGYSPVDWGMLNWCFCISRKSRAVNYRLRLKEENKFKNIIY